MRYFVLIISLFITTLSFSQGGKLIKIKVNKGEPGSTGLTGPAGADGADGVAGTVVTATVVVAEDGDVPAAFVAVTLIVQVVAEDRDSTVIGEEDPVAVLVVYPAAVAVTVKEVAEEEPAGNSKDTVAAPLLKALLVPTFVATMLTGARGSRKSFCCDDFPPASFFAIYSAP